MCHHHHLRHPSLTTLVAVRGPVGVRFQYSEDELLRLEWKKQRGRDGSRDLADEKIVAIVQEALDFVSEIIVVEHQIVVHELIVLVIVERLYI